MKAARSKAEKLAITGAVAPTLREQAGVAARRKVIRVDQDGNVVGYTTLLEVQKQLMARHALEIEVQPDEKPREVVCVRCGLPRPVKAVGRPPAFCARCTSAKCHDCGALLKEGSTAPCRNARLAEAGKPRRCIDCRRKAELANRVACADCKTLLSAKESSRARRLGKAQVRCRPCYLAHRSGGES